jgi:hypothetical protein
MQFSAKHWRTSIALVAVVAALVVPAASALASNSNPGVLPPQSHPHGLTYGQWSARWWQWEASFPASANPGTDLTGSECALGQSGPFVIRRLWFLTGLFSPLGGTVTRTCTVPVGRTILFPVFNAEWSQVEQRNNGDQCIVPASPSGESDAALQACVTAQIDLGISTGGVLQADVDGRQVQNLLNYRALSPPFDVTGVPGNPVFPVTGPGSVTTRSVADGFWIMLAPLPPGPHTIHFRADLTQTPFAFLVDVTYDLTIAR